MEARATRRGLLTATEFEFRHRFWLIGLVFSLGFSLYTVDHVNVVQYVIDRSVGSHSPLADGLARSLFALAALCVLGAVLLRTWAAAYLRTSVVQDPGVRTEAIVADGPYRHLRNPLYLGGILVAVGFGFLASRAGFVVIVAGLALFFFRLIGLEETRLAREQGDRYREFCRRVPRMWPALRPRVPSSGLEPKWRQAFLGESFMWGVFLAIAAFAVTLRIVITWIVLGLVLGLTVAIGALDSKRKARRE